MGVRRPSNPSTPRTNNFPQSSATTGTGNVGVATARSRGGARHVHVSRTVKKHAKVPTAVKKYVKQAIKEPQAKGLYKRLKYGSLPAGPSTNEYYTTDTQLINNSADNFNQFVFFTTSKVLDAASVLFNGRTAGFDHKVATGLFDKEELRVDTVYMSAVVNFRNLQPHSLQFRIIEWECKSHRDAPFLNEYAAAITAMEKAGGTTWDVDSFLLSPTATPAMKTNYVMKEHKFTLEPGQETSYTYVQKGGRFDQAAFNVVQGGSDGQGQPQYMPRFSSDLLVICRSEMVTDTADADVNYGSGHVACLIEQWKSWAAIPFIKPFQSSFQNDMGAIAQGQEEDLNISTALNQGYNEYA